MAKVIDKCQALKKRIREEKPYLSQDTEVLFELRHELLAYGEMIASVKMNVSRLSSEQQMMYDVARKSAYDKKRDEGVTMDRAELYKLLGGAGYYIEHNRTKHLAIRLREMRDYFLAYEKMLTSRVSEIKQENNFNQFVKK